MLIEFLPGVSGSTSSTAMLPAENASDGVVAQLVIATVPVDDCRTNPYHAGVSPPWPGSGMGAGRNGSTPVASGVSLVVTALQAATGIAVSMTPPLALPVP